MTEPGRPNPTPWHAEPPESALAGLRSGVEGLSREEARARLERHGPNRIEPPPPPPWWRLVLRQFASPLIYILIAAALIALALRELADTAFIVVVLMINAVIGLVNESRAERKVRSLAGLVRTHARVRRGGRALDVDGEEVVPGDVILLESGDKVPADARILDARALRVEEGLLTGESLPVEKGVDPVPAATTLAERSSMVFAGTLVVSGRCAAVVVAPPPPPLILRMRRFAHAVGMVALGVSAAVVAVGLARGQPVQEVLLGAIALAVSAVPEGLPIALTVALAIAVSRMASRRVVVRHLPAVEALGSCGVIATDKTGTLTRNELVVERILVGGRVLEVSGVGYAPLGEITAVGERVSVSEDPLLERLLAAAALANEGTLEPAAEGQDGWRWSGDPTDVALLAVARKAGSDPDEGRARKPLRHAQPFESERRYAASFHDEADGVRVCVKGAPERVFELCTAEATPNGTDATPLDPARVLERVRELMAGGHRVLAVADGRLPSIPAALEEVGEPAGLTLLGFVAMTDPPREGVEQAVARCRSAGVRVVMITGDHAVTAAAIAVRIGITRGPEPVLEGSEIAAMDDEALADAAPRYAVVARATPADKLRVVRALQQGGAFVAVTGDGVNDAPALRQANLGVAMGLRGTDVAREAAELVITDDDFASIVAGVEEGRIAYDNVRKVTYLLVSTGAGEVILVLAAVILGLPVPFTAVQLLWLNLVTNGIQDVALAFEPGEPGVLARPPRPPRERIFNAIMIERTLLAGLVFAGVGLACWVWALRSGLFVADARNLLVQLFVLFEIFHIGNARSENISVFRLSPLRNPVLLLGTLSALGIHLAALHLPFFQRLLGIQPISLAAWAVLAALAASILVVMELHKRLRRPPRLHEGIPHRLRAYADLLEASPELRERTVLVRLAVPSRTGIPQYEHTRGEIETLVAEINTRFGTADWTPNRYVYGTWTHEELLAWYVAADVAVVTPLRDGMNLVAKEFMAANRGRGVLVLSRWAGAADDLGPGALLVDPLDPRSLVSVLREALAMPGPARQARVRIAQHHLRNHDVRRWASTFLSTLERASDAG